MLATMERLPFNTFPTCTSIPPSHSPPLTSPRPVAAIYGPASSYRPLQTSDRMHYAASARNPAAVHAGTSSSMPLAVQSPPPYHQSDIMAEPANGPIYTNSSSLLPSDHEPAHPSGAAMPSTTTIPHSNYASSPTTTAVSTSNYQSPSGESLSCSCFDKHEYNCVTLSI